MLGRYDRAMRARQPVGRLTLLQQAIAAIRRNNGTLFYVPQNFSGAWTDSAGTDPVDAVADVIGRMTDRTGGSAVATQATTASKPLVSRVPKRLGPNLVSNGSITGLPAGGGTRFYNMTGAMTPLVADKTYLMTYTVSGYSGTGNVGIAGSAPAGIVQINCAANGSYRAIQTPTAGGVIVFYTLNTNTANFSAITVQEVLEWSYAMSFDGSNDSLNTNITTGNEGWICAGLNFAVLNKSETIFCSGGTSDATKGVWLIKLVSGIRIGIANGTSTVTAITAAIAANTQTCIEGYWDASSVSAQVNGGTVYSNARTGCATPTSAAKIGTTLSDAFPIGADMSAMVVCQTLPSAADRAIIRKWIGSLQGQTL